MGASSKASYKVCGVVISVEDTQCLAATDRCEQVLDTTPTSPCYFATSLNQALLVSPR
jgi:hypothetical protein